MIKTEWSFTIIADMKDSDDQNEKDDLQIIEIIKDLLKATEEYNSGNKIYISFCLKAKQSFVSNINPLILLNSNKEEIVIFNGSSKNYEIIECDISTSEGIKLIFENYVSSKINASFFGLLTWGHGAVYSFFSRLNKINEFSNTDIADNLKMINSKDIYHDFFDTQKNLQISDRYLNMDELSNGILLGMNRKIDLIVMAHCYMAYYETGRMMNLCSKYWVATLNVTQFNSINFKEVFNYIHTNTSIVSPNTLSIKFIPIIDENGKKQRKNDFFSYDLLNYGMLKKEIFALAGFLLDELEKNGVDAIKSARQKCIDLKETSNYHVINLVRFCETVKVELNENKNISAACDKIIRVLKKIILDNGIDADLGISIFFPESFQDRQSMNPDILDRLGMPQINTLRKAKWEYFILNYLRKQKP